MVFPGCPIEFVLHGVPRLSCRVCPHVEILSSGKSCLGLELLKIAKDMIQKSIAELQLSSITYSTGQSRAMLV